MWGRFLTCGGVFNPALLRTVPTQQIAIAGGCPSLKYSEPFAATTEKSVYDKAIDRRSVCRPENVRHYRNRAKSNALYEDGPLEMHLNQREASLLQTFRRLLPATAAELSALAERLATLSPDIELTGQTLGPPRTCCYFRASSFQRLDAAKRLDAAEDGKDSD
jgi:hypothetical protein